MIPESKILSTEWVKPGSHFDKVLQAAKLLGYHYVRFNGKLYTNDGTEVVTEEKSNLITEDQKRTLACSLYLLSNYNQSMEEYLERSIVCINETLNQRN